MRKLIVLLYVSMIFSTAVYAEEVEMEMDLMQNIEDVNKSTKMWKLIYGLTIVKQGEEDLFVGKNDEEEEENDKEEGIQKEKGDNTVEDETQKGNDMATAKEQQIDQSV